MKKFVLFVVLFFIPIFVKAVSISNVTISGPKSAKYGDQIEVNVRATISNYQSDETIQIAYAEIVFNQTNLVLLKAETTPGFYGEFGFTENGDYYLIDIYDFNNTGGDTCSFFKFYCGTTYNIKLTFFVDKRSNEITDSIKIKNFTLGNFMYDINTDYTNYKAIDYVEEAGEISYSKTASHSITLKPSSANVTKPKGITTTKKATKSSNNNLKELTVKDHEFEFNKNSTSYSLLLKEETTLLDITAKADHSKAKVDISGNKELKDGSKITIKVTAEDGKTKSYFINIKKEEVIVPVKDDFDFKNIFSKISKKMIIIGSCVLGGIILILIIVGIVKFKNNRELDKILKENM